MFVVPDEIAVTKPFVAFIVATAVLDELHTMLSVVVVDSVVVPFTHKLASPVIAGVAGNPFTVTTKSDDMDSHPSELVIV